MIYDAHNQASYKLIIKEITAKIRINLCLDEQVEDADRDDHDDYEDQLTDFDILCIEGDADEVGEQNGQHPTISID